MEDKTPLTAEEVRLNLGNIHVWHSRVQSFIRWQSPEDKESAMEAANNLKNWLWDYMRQRGFPGDSNPKNRIKDLEQQTAYLQERVTQLESDKEQLHKVIVGHEETNIALSEQIAELEQRNKALEKCSDQQQKLIELDVKALNDLTQQNKNFIKWLELEIRDNAEWWQNPATLWQSFLKEHGLTE